MKKLMLKGMAALAVCAAFVSCSHDTDFEASNQEFTVENLKNEYKAAFIQKYGEVAPNQSWDFTGLLLVQEPVVHQVIQVVLAWIGNRKGMPIVKGME